MPGRDIGTRASYILFCYVLPNESALKRTGVGAIDGITSGTGSFEPPPFERIVAEHGPLVSRIAMTYEADPTLREDLTQQIFLAVWQALPSYRADASLKTFIARIAQNRAISFVAKQVRQPPTAEIPEILESDDPDPEQSAMEASERRALIAATRKLPPPQREVIVLVLEGFDYAEIAKMLEIAPNALALRLSRAKSALKAMLERGR